MYAGWMKKALLVAGAGALFVMQAGEAHAFDLVGFAKKKTIGKVKQVYRDAREVASITKSLGKSGGRALHGYGKGLAAVTHGVLRPGIVLQPGIVRRPLAKPRQGYRPRGIPRMAPRDRVRDFRRSR